MSDENRTVADEIEDDEKIKEIKDEFQEEPETVSLSINRVPKYVSDDLKDEAEEYFANDYGMALTFWHREQKSLEVMQDRINHLKERIDQMERLLSQALNTEDDKDDDEEENKLSTIN